jgi:DDE family transposase
MQLPSTDPETLFEDLLQDLPSETMTMAYEFKAFTRARKIKTPHQLLRVVLLYCGLDQSLREVAGTFTLLSERLTDEAIAQRLAACRPWVKALLTRMLERPTLAALPTSRRFLVIDGSSIQGPGATGTHYRLHLCLDLVTLELTQLLITDTHTGESLKHWRWAPGDVAVADRGYSHPAAMVQTVQAGADLLVRLNPHSVPLCQHDGTPLDLVAALKHQPQAILCSFPVVIGTPPGATQEQGWVHAYRLAAPEAANARAACRKRSRKKGRTPQQTTLYLAGWVLVWTSLPPTLLSAETILAVYRLRWQVELAIKRWKSLLNVDALRTRDGSPLADLWLHGKLLYALLLDRRLRRQLGAAWGHVDQERTATWWRPWKLMQEAITPMISGALSWQSAHWEQCVQVLAERPRRRKLQQLPAGACIILQLSQTHSIQPQPQEKAA